MRHALATTLILAVSAIVAQAGAPTQDWTDLPELVAPGSKARAHGDPAMGIYVLEDQTVVPAGTEASALTLIIAEDLLGKGFTVAPEAGAGPGALAFSARNLRGTIRVEVAGAAAKIRTCFYNEREPERSSAMCRELFTSPPP